MKAAVIYENGSPDVLPDPECPDGRVLIDVEAISIEGGDLLARDGSPPPSVPHIVGYLAAGTVVAVAAGVIRTAAAPSPAPDVQTASLGHALGHAAIGGHPARLS